MKGPSLPIERCARVKCRVDLLTTCCALALFTTVGVQAQTLVINEMMSANAETLRDRSGRSSDWIEIYNSGATPLDLAGTGLSDDIEQPFKWEFPSIVLPAGGYLVVFASGEDAADSVVHFETVVDRGDAWRYIVPSSEPSAAWRTAGFDDGGWLSGPTGIGYGDGDDATEVPAGTTSVYARRSFTVDDPADVTNVLFDIDFDDGFVAFLNGVEIARANLAGLGTLPVYSDEAPEFTEPRLVSSGELLHFEFAGADLLLAGENVLAIQLYNNGPGSSDLTLIPFLTLGMSRVPDSPRGAADILDLGQPGFHTNFKLDADGETLTLTSPEAGLLDVVETGFLPVDVSFGRYPNGTGAFAYHETATPRAENSDAGYALIGETPSFSHTAGYYPDSFSLLLSKERPVGNIHYTIDGSVPEETAPRATGPIPIDDTTVVRARVLGDGVLPGETVTRTFIVDERFELPVMSISTNPEHFFDNDTGIYVRGDSSEPNFPHFGSNFWEDWERPVHLEFIEPDGTVLFSLGAGVKIFGGWSRGHAQKSLSFFARARYGANNFPHQLFPEKDIDKFEAFILRNSGNDWQRAHFRDAAQTSLLDRLDIDRQGYRPMVVFLNGEYWGMMNLREKINEHFIESNNKGVDSEAIDLLERERTVLEGDAAHWLELVDLVSNGDLTQASVYEDIIGRMEVDNFIDYQAAQIYYDNTDWPGNNIKFWRPRVDGGRWRWIIYDTDFGFGIWNSDNYLNNTLQFAMDTAGPSWPNPPWSTLFLRRLVTNSEFREDFVNRFATHLNTVFDAPRVVERIDEMEDGIEADMPGQRARWGSSVGEWRNHVQNMRNFANRRVAQVRNHIRSAFGLGSNSSLEVDLYTDGGGIVEIHGIPVPEYPWTGVYFRNIPIRLTARPHPGFRFTGWNGVGPSDVLTETIILSSPQATVTAGFEVDCDSLGSVLIHEINYNASVVDVPPPGTDPGDWVELYNRSSRPVDLAGWTFRDESGAGFFTFAQGTSLPAGGFLVLASDPAAFEAVHAGVSSLIGPLGFAFEGGGETLTLLDAVGETVDRVSYDDVAPWPEEADGTGATLARSHPMLAGDFGPHWAASAAGGTPGAANDDVFVEIDHDCEEVIEEGLFLRGDCDGNGIVELTDAICTLDWRFLGGEPPACIAATDTNVDGWVDISDAVATLGFLFLGGPPPSQPFPDCGFLTLPTDFALGCEVDNPGC